MADFAELEAALRAAADRLQEREHLRSKLHELDGQITAADRSLAAARAQAADEEQDVAALQGVTVTRVLASVRGNRDLDLDRERIEADAARLRSAEAQAALDVLRSERESVASAHAALDDARSEHAVALAAKEQWLTESGTGGGARLLAIATETGTAQAQLREVHEAEQAAARAMRALADVEDSLSSARGWSTYDTFLGGGALSSMAKHNQMDKAREAAARADQEMRTLASEVSDVPGVGAALPGLQVDGTTRFLDVWFDNIFTDWTVRQRITEAQENTTRAHGAVESVRRVLEQRATELTTLLERLADERHRLLGAGDLPDERPAPPPSAPPVIGHTGGPSGSGDEPYPTWAAIGAGVCTLFAPFISLVVALVMRSGEARPRRRGFLMTWAIASAAWLCTGFLLAIAIIASVTGGPLSDECRGGVDLLTPPEYVSSDGENWTVIRQCVDGGSRTRELPPGQDPMRPRRP